MERPLCTHISMQNATTPVVFCLVLFHVGFPGWLHVQVMEVALVSSLLVHEELCWSETCDL